MTCGKNEGGDCKKQLYNRVLCDVSFFSAILFILSIDI